ncbi:MAG: type II toxin-antitoxin system Phd/YefM family antitoxin [Negativicutes bacterium]|jgi:prevent-host-death family protein
MSVINATAARANFYKIVDEAIDNHEPICVTAKKGNVIIISEDDWRSMQETLYLLSIPGMRESLIEGKNTPISECVVI